MDTFWSRETSAVSSTLTNAKKILKTFEEVGLKRSFVSWGPTPEWGYCGNEVAIDVVIASRRGEAQQLPNLV